MIEIEVDTLISIIICFLSSILLIALTVLVIKMINTLKKVDKVIDDVSVKSSKLDGVFNIVESVTDTVNSIGDKVSNSIVGMVSNIINRRKRKDDENE